MERPVLESEGICPICDSQVVFRAQNPWLRDYFACTNCWTMEHLLDPAKAFKEIGRVLKPGGAHIFTVPLVNKDMPSSVRARRTPNRMIEYLAPAEYHANPADEEHGALVTMHWGFDICDFIYDHSRMTTTIVKIDDLSKGIRADLIEVLVSKKRS